ncbi:hypothetical protein AVEN_251263-1 [Araneus ventricosus]|uniref:Uncharacterized protein n=1 Tax=Araneus ventricosus TaxID=182803 RepID=A0A4Y1ZVK4_ARAVE|nr:hypothetical protein AVEN_240991-1 [Araneus ventricosus]GBL70464.1 hypothetical protein AVEN_251263-1 [Araneus ventricosus]
MHSVLTVANEVNTVCVENLGYLLYNPPNGHSSKFLVPSEPQVTRDTIPSSLKTSQHSNVESSLIHFPLFHHPHFQNSLTGVWLDESNTIGKVEKNAVFPHIPTAAFWSSFFVGVVPDNPQPG